MTHLSPDRWPTHEDDFITNQQMLIEQLPVDQRDDCAAAFAHYNKEGATFRSQMGEVIARGLAFRNPNTPPLEFHLLVEPLHPLLHSVNGDDGQFGPALQDSYSGIPDEDIYAIADRYVARIEQVLSQKKLSTWVDQDTNALQSHTIVAIPNLRTLLGQLFRDRDRFFKADTYQNGQSVGNLPPAKIPVLLKHLCSGMHPDDHYVIHGAEHGSAPLQFAQHLFMSAKFGVDLVKTSQHIVFGPREQNQLSNRPDRVLLEALKQTDLPRSSRIQFGALFDTYNFRRENQGNCSSFSDQLIKQGTIIFPEKDVVDFYGLNHAAPLN